MKPQYMKTYPEQSNDLGSSSSSSKRHKSSYVPVKDEDSTEGYDISRKFIASHEVSKNISCLAVLYPPETNPLLITGSDDSTVCIWDVVKAELLQKHQCPASVTAVTTYCSFVKEVYHCQIIVCGTFARFLNMGIPANRTRLEIVAHHYLISNKTFEAVYHEKAVSSVLVHELRDRNDEAPILVIASFDKSISVWDFVGRSFLFKLQTKHTDLLLSVAIFDPGQGRERLRFITGSWDKTVMFHFFQDPNRYQRHDSPVTDETDPKTKRNYIETLTLQKGHYHELRGHTKSVTTIAAYNLKGTTDANKGRICAVLVTGSLDKTAIIWDIESKEKVRTLRGHEGKITAVSIYDSDVGSPPIVITAAEDGKSILWDLLSGEKIRELLFPDKVLCQAIVRNKHGLIIATGGPKAKTTITNLCRTDRTRKFATAAVTAIACWTPRHENDFFKDPIVVIGDIEGNCTIFDLNSHTKIDTVNHHGIRINVMTIYTPSDPNQHPLVISGDGKAVVVVWDLFTREVLKRIEAHEKAVFCIGLFDPQKCPRNHAAMKIARPQIITAGIDKRIMVWDLLSDNLNNHRLHVIEPSDAGGTHTDFIRYIVVHHPQTVDGEPLFITTSYDRTVVVWSLCQRMKLYTLRLHQDYAFFCGLYDPIAHVGEGYRREGVDNDFFVYPTLVTCSFDKTIAIWSLKPPADPTGAHGTIIQSEDHHHTCEEGHCCRHSTSSDGVCRLKYHCHGHRDSVTALNVYVPRSDDETPLIISGSIDRTVIVWNLFTGEQLQKLIGHTDRVCCITSYIPVDGKNPLVLSGSDDRTTIVWEDSLYSKPFMPLRDDVNRCFDSDCLEEDWPLITELALTYKSQLFLENSNLFFLAVKYDRPDFLLKFRKYLALVLPLMKSHHQDQNTKSNINLLKYSIDLNDLISVRILLLCWIENLNKDIKDELTQQMFHAIYFFPDDDLGTLATRYPLEFKHFITSLRLIRNHPSLLLNRDAIRNKTAFLQLRKDYHIEWTNPEVQPFSKERELSLTFPHNANTTTGNNDSFIRRLSLSSVIQSLYDRSNLVSETEIEVKESLNERNNTRILRLHPSRRYEVEATDDPIMKFDELWNKTFICGTFWSYLAREWREFIYHNPDPQPITSLMIPLRNTAKLQESLRLYVEVSNQVDSVDIFNSDVGMISLHYYWEYHAKKFHILAFAKYLMLQFLFMTGLYAFQFYYVQDSVNHAEKVLILLLNGVTLFIFVYYGYEEVLQYWYFSQTKAKTKKFEFRTRTLLENSFLDLWNVLDILILCTAGLGIVLRFIYDNDTTVGRCFLATGSIFMWFKVLYFLRPFSTSGPLVTMILQIAYEIRFFLLVLFCVLLGFTQALWLLSNKQSDLPWGTMKEGFLSSFLLMLGAGDIDPLMEGTVAPALATLFLVLFMMIVIILMLNLLIALMGDAFTNVRAKGLAVWRKEQASIIVDESFLFHHKTPIIKPYLHVLKYTSEVGNVDDEENVSYKDSTLVKLVEMSRANVLEFTDLPDTKKTYHEQGAIAK